MHAPIEMPVTWICKLLMTDGKPPIKICSFNSLSTFPVRLLRLNSIEFAAQLAFLNAPLFFYILYFKNAEILLSSRILNMLTKFYFPIIPISYYEHWARVAACGSSRVEKLHCSMKYEEIRKTNLRTNGYFGTVYSLVHWCDGFATEQKLGQNERQTLMPAQTVQSCQRCSKNDQPVITPHTCKWSIILSGKEILTSEGSQGRPWGRFSVPPSVHH